MDLNSILLTAITTPFELFKYLYMPFRLWNTRATFQQHMDNILQGMTNVLAYVDDIIVFHANEKEHKRHLPELFQRLSKYGMIINATKSEFGLQKLKFLGYLVTPEEILPVPDRVQAIEDYLKSTTAKQSRAYLGLLNYYCRFVKDLTLHLRPLLRYVKKSKKKAKRDLIEWSAENELA